MKHSLRSAVFILFSFLLLNQPKAGNLEFVSGIPGTINEVRVNGNIAYCAANNGLLILDYSNPVSPVVLSYLSLPDAAGSIDLQGNYAYLSAGSAGLRIINVADPEHPFETGNYNAGPNSQCWGIDVSGNHAYLAYGMEGFRIVDITDPVNPVETGSFILPEADIFSRVVVSGNIAFTNVGSTVYALNVEDPDLPALLGTKTIIGEITDMEIRQNMLLCVSNFNDFSSSFYGLVVLNVQNPSAITQIGQYDTQEYSYKLCLKDNLCYLGNGTAGIAVLNVDALGLITYVGNSSGFSSPVRFAEVWGNRIFAGGEKLGLQLFNLDAPAVLTRISDFRTLHDSRDIQVAGNFAYIADGRNGLVVVDISDPVKPLITGQVPNSGNGLGLALNNNYAYIADGQNGIAEYNISDPSNLQQSGSVTTDNWAQDLVIRNNIGYVAVDVLGLQLLNLSIPGLPSVAGNAYDLPGTSYGIALNENMALVASGGAGLHLVNVSSPAQPVLVSSYDTPGSAYDVFPVGNRAYIADSQGGIIVVDISDPQLPQGLGQSVVPGDARQVIISGNYAFVSDWTYGLRVFDVTDPSAMNEAYTYALSGTAHNIAINGEYIYIASGTSGLTVLRNPLSTGIEGVDVSQPVSVTVFPNPFHEDLKLCILSDQTIESCFSLFDVSGREVLQFPRIIWKPGDEAISLITANPLVKSLKPGVYMLKSVSGFSGTPVKLIKH
ncbi:MAG: hypothetical protein IPN08_02910 [Bacteroidales bacterium]|nr:hypothetical protein [Bacteroidales bacterium]